MKLIFFGTPPIAAHLLEFLLKQQDVTLAAIITRPDRPQGRKGMPQPSAVKQLALAQYPDIPLYQPEKASTEAFASEIAKYEPDFFIVIAYGEIIGQKLLDIPKILPINVHASLLPKYRGAAPIQRCLMEGATESGVTIMEMVRKMDAGDILKKVKIFISKEMTAGELELEIEKAAGPALLSVLKDFLSGRGKKISQDESEATYAPKISNEDRRIHWERKAQDIHNQIRSLSPRPGAYCEIKIQSVIKRLIIRRSRLIEGMSAAPKTILKFENGMWSIACGGDALALIEVQLEGKKALPVKEFLLGFSEAPELI